jgi:hypothetical protein
MNKILEYGGIADARGIESFIPFNKLTRFHELRASANRHRHAVLFKVNIDKITLDTVNSLMEEGDYESALLELKLHAEEVFLAKGSEKSWKMIPNPDLDPYA